MGEGRDPLGIVGTTIADKYAIESVVGGGGFAVVYRATHVLWKRPVAVKVFNALAEVAPDQRQALLDDFIQEGALLAELSERSAAICQARDIGMMTSPRGLAIPYMVLEWLEGRSLEDVLEAERRAGAPLRSLAAVVHLLDPIADALSLAHKKGIAHRDVKPANVFVLEDAQRTVTGVKLLDFGIAKVVQDAQKMGFGKTSGNVTSFTPLYGAPEQFNRAHGATGPWTDVFALALVVAEVVSGREPMSGDDLVQLAFAAANPAVRPTPRTLGVPTSDDVEAVFQRAVAVKPSDRFQTAGEFWSVLRERVLGDPQASRGSVRMAAADARRATGEEATMLADTAGAPVSGVASSHGAAGQSTPASASPASAPSAPSRGPFLAGVAVALVAAAGIGVFVARGKTEDTPKPPPSSAVVAAPSAHVDASAPMDASVPPLAALPDVSNGKCPRGMAFIPGGMFFMGSDDAAADKDEKPAHGVRVSPYCLDIYEVSVEAYHQCSDRGMCLRPAKVNTWEGITPAQGEIFNPLCNENDIAGRAKHPVNCVDWEQASMFCREERGGRLPTEAEWELAARGPEQRLYPWGDTAPNEKLLNACGSECVAWKKTHPDPANDHNAMYAGDDGFATTAPVGSFPASKYGLYDIAGNVWEWVADWHGPYKKTKESPLDPQGPSTGRARVLRGGAWNGSDKAWVKPAYRYAAAPQDRGYAYGFRCVHAPL